MTDRAEPPRSEIQTHPSRSTGPRSKTPPNKIKQTFCEKRTKKHLENKIKQKKTFKNKTKQTNFKTKQNKTFAKKPLAKQNKSFATQNKTKNM